MNFTQILCFCAVLISGNCQMLPTPTTLLCWLLNVTSNEIQTITSNFNFRSGDSPSDIKFLLYIRTPNTPPQNKTKEITPNDIDPSKFTNIIAPGWKADPDAEFPVNMANSYLKKSDFNVIVIDWTKYSKGYATSLNNTSKMSLDSKPVENSIRTKLNNQLETSHLEVINESYMHNVPKGSETHFKVVVVSDKFCNIPLIQRHRMVNEALQEELQTSVHALSIVAKTPEQWKTSDQNIQPSPNCRGGFGK